MGFIQLSSMVRPKTHRKHLPSVLKKDKDNQTMRNISPKGQARTHGPHRTLLPKTKLGMENHMSHCLQKIRGVQFFT